ncbi:hypothetical protein KX729_32495 [Rhizobium sp. XQZ8]|uniref:hypothetical protein n=1 Tax=Rhizobium populisoli TaxID=2859785 RepID=UPI001CA47FEA|nr:hypothetical protein [Rhizobium populisoli]MBW6426086.1 hypothetical protein [Rhizobium populisoli]
MADAMIGRGRGGTCGRVAGLPFMFTLVSFTAVTIGTVVLGIAMSIALRHRLVSVVMIVAGLIGATYGFIDGGRDTISNPPDVTLPAGK